MMQKPERRKGWMFGVTRVVVIATDRFLVQLSLAWSKRALGTTVIFILAYAVSEAALAREMTNTQRNYLQRLSFEFAASKKSFAFMLGSEGKPVELALVDRESQLVQVIRDSDAHLMSPSFSADSERLIFVRQSRMSRSYELILCEVRSIGCRSIVRSDRPIFSPVEISKDVYLFSSENVGDGGKTSPGRDFWVSDRSGVRAVSTFKYYQLNSISVSESHIYYSALALTRPARSGVGFLPVGDIYRVGYTVVDSVFRGFSGSPEAMFRDQIASTRVAVGPSGSIAAFLKPFVLENLAFRYDLVIANVGDGTPRIERANGIGFSRPAVLDDEVLANEVSEDQFVVKSFDVSSQRLNDAFRLTNETVIIDGLKRIDLPSKLQR